VFVILHQLNDPHLNKAKAVDSLDPLPKDLLSPSNSRGITTPSNITRVVTARSKTRVKTNPNNSKIAATLDSKLVIKEWKR
jgi:hypothetical protein